MKRMQKKNTLISHKQALDVCASLLTQSMIYSAPSICSCKLIKEKPEQFNLSVLSACASLPATFSQARVVNKRVPVFYNAHKTILCSLPCYTHIAVL